MRVCKGEERGAPAADKAAVADKGASTRGPRWEPHTATATDLQEPNRHQLLIRNLSFLLQTTTLQIIMSFRAAMKHWYDPAAIPIYVVIGTAMGGAGWYLTRLARGPDIIWARHSNPQPWNDVKPG
ncbi:hypothetical protein MJO28_015599 [Puccinia striiformis f. sp. tritici]|nr:hypothetical protein MJO29_015782 [Puccinia striiformis f. sp. tritici]KAI7936700.1 hypothetical protein MJO28_015599 [Puccinia striiformis f. sp. tritici]